MTEEINKGKFRINQGFLLITLTIVFIGFSVYLFQISFTHKYYQLDYLFAAVAFSLLMLYILINGFSEYKAVTIYKDNIKVRWLFGLISMQLTPIQLKQFGLSSAKKIPYIYIKSDRVEFLLNQNLIENDLYLID